MNSACEHSLYIQRHHDTSRIFKMLIYGLKDRMAEAPPHPSAPPSPLSKEVGRQGQY